MENGAPTGPSLDRHLNFTERIEERHILASRRALANNKAGGAQMRPPRTPGCKHKLAGIGRLLVLCASQARMHTTHDPHHEKVAAFEEIDSQSDQTMNQFLRTPSPARGVGRE